MSPANHYVLVTGGNGFVGSNIVKFLAQNKRRVLMVDIDPPGPLLTDYLEGSQEYVDSVQVNLTDYDKVMRIGQDYKLNGIIHAAVFTVVTKEVEQARSREILNTNLMGTVNMLELARAAGVKRFVYVSSSGVYGSTPDVDMPVTEDSTQPYLQRGDFYIITKVTSEKLTERYSQLFPMTTTSMRIAAPYGCMERPTSTRNVMGVVFNLLRLVLTEKRKIIHVKGSDYVRDFTYVMDTARGLVAGLDAPGPLSPIYNVSSGVNSSVKNILEAIKESSGVDFEWKEVKEDKEADYIVAGSTRGPLSIEKAGNELGFRPQYNLKQGIKEYCEWWKRVARR